MDSNDTSFTYCFGIVAVCVVLCVVSYNGASCSKVYYQTHTNIIHTIRVEDRP